MHALEAIAIVSNFSFEFKNLSIINRHGYVYANLSHINIFGPVPSTRTIKLHEIAFVVCGAETKQYLSNERNCLSPELNVVGDIMR